MQLAKLSSLVFVAMAVTVARAGDARAQQPLAPPAITRTTLLTQVLPKGDFRNVQTVVVELAPNASAPPHRHDVAVMAYVLEGEVENRFDGGSARSMRTGEAWWEPPGTVHNVARNTSATTKARLLLVYIGEEGKALSVPVGEQTARIRE